MRRKRGLRVAMVVWLGVTCGVLAATGTARAQQATPPPTEANDSPGLTAVAAVAGTIGSAFYVPFKVAAICPGMALFSGASLAVTGGDTDTAGYLLRAGCAGTYFITPGMVRGLEEFRAPGTR